ncbi:MAG: thiamine pyrophosphate-binding protein [Deltaproteobacteria bacterium]|nr:thiamine pyrophosphate-binding protein [Deltaproteobacteria bacterium]
MKATEYIVQALVQEKLDHVFMVPGGLIDNFYPALCNTAGIRPIVAAHEGGAAYMADGYARASGRFGACFVIGGPGVTNTVTALSAALTDQSPVFLLSGEVPTDWEGRGGFQDASAAGLNDIEILRPVTSYSYEVESCHLLHFHLRAALRQMMSLRRGPVHLSLAENLQTQEITVPYEPLPENAYSPRLLDEPALLRFADTLISGQETGAEPRRIVILAGNGAHSSGAAAALLAFAERFEIPVATTLRAKGVFPEDHRLSLGVFGYSGTRPACETILSDEVEVLIVLGSGLNQRDTLFWEKRFRPKRVLAQVDLDPSVIGKNYAVDAAITGDCFSFLKKLSGLPGPYAEILSRGKTERSEWLSQILSRGPRLYEAEHMDSEAVPLHPARVLRDFRKIFPREGVLMVDSGAHRAFCGHYWETYAPGTYLSATNLGPMGWAIPAGIGAKLARPQLPVAVVTGDGCMLMHGMEIQTAARYQIPVIYVVLNNQALGNVYLRAKKMGVGPADLTEIPLKNWAAFAESLGAKGLIVEKPEQLLPAFETAMASRGPIVLDIRCGRDYTTPVTPWAQAKQEWMDDD